MPVHKTGEGGQGAPSTQTRPVSQLKQYQSPEASPAAVNQCKLDDFEKDISNDITPALWARLKEIIWGSRGEFKGLGYDFSMDKIDVIQRKSSPKGGDVLYEMSVKFGDNDYVPVDIAIGSLIDHWGHGTKVYSGVEVIVEAENKYETVNLRIDRESGTIKEYDQFHQTPPKPAPLVSSLRALRDGKSYCKAQD